MRKKIVAAILAVCMMCEGSISYAAEKQVQETIEFADESQQGKIVTTSEPKEVLVEEPEVNAIEKSGTLDGAIYWSVENNVLTITNQGSDRAIPDVSIEEPAPWRLWSNSIKQVIIQSGITGIGEYAFYDMSALEKVTINSSQLTSIEEHAFDSCTNLKEINLPDTLKDMGIYAFARCKSLNKISTDGFVTPASLTEIPDYAFAECGGITNVTFSENVQSIDPCAFYNCGSLRTIEFKGTSLKVIGDYAFSKSGLESVVIPDGIQTIDVYAFANCNSLKSVGIMAEKSLEYIGTGAFEKCAGLTGFYVMAGSYAESYGKQQWPNICKTYTYMTNDRKNNYSIQITGDTTYTGKEVKPKITISLGNTTLQEDVDYILSYSNNVDVGNNAKITITGINAFYGSMDEYFTITAFDISKTGKVSSINNQVYTGKEVKPGVTVTVNGITLTKDKDYTVSYQNNVNVGQKAKIIITGIGAYTGKIETYFTIIANLSNEKVPVKKQVLNNAKVTVKKQVYTGKNLKPKATVELNGTKLVEGTDYKVTYSNNKKIGKSAKVTITGVGAYEGTITKKFTIAPPKPKMKLSGKKLKITNYQTGADVYLTYTAKINGTKKSGKLLWQAKKYKAKKCVDLTQLVKKYQGGKLTITVTMKVNSVESASSKKVTVK